MIIYDRKTYEEVRDSVLDLMKKIKQKVIQFIAK